MTDPTARVQLARCEACSTYPRFCFDPPQAHTWMGDDDAAPAGLTWPLTSEQRAANPCACECAGGPGACVEVVE